MTDWRQAALNATGGVVAICLVLLLAYCLYALVNVEIPTTNKDPLLVVIGILSGSLGAVTQYYFGSSAGAKKQADTIDRLAATNQAVTNAAVPSAPTIPLSPGDTVTVEGKE